MVLSAACLGMAKTKGGHSHSQQSLAQPDPRGRRPPPTVSNRKSKEDEHASRAGPSRSHVDPGPLVESDTYIGRDIEYNVVHPTADLTGDDHQQDAPIDAPSTSVVSIFPYLGGLEDRSVLPSYGSHFTKSRWDGLVSYCS